MDMLALVWAAGYLGIAAIIFAESGLLIGIILPGDSLLFTAGFLASQGHLKLIPLIVACWLAAFVGDTVGYWLGKRFGPRVFTRQGSFFLNPNHIGRAKLFFRKHGPKTVIIARFIPVMRTLVPMLAGIGRMRRRTFMSFNIIGAFVWAMGVPLTGYWLGAAIPNIDRYIFPIVAGIIIVSAAPTVWQLVIHRFARSSRGSFL